MNSLYTRGIKCFCSRDGYSQWAMWVLSLKMEDAALNSHQREEGIELLSITSLHWTLSLPLGRRKDASSGGIIQPWPLALLRIKMSTGTYFQEFCSRSPQRRKALFWGRGESGSAGCLPVSSVWGCSGSPSSAQRWSPFQPTAGDHFRSSAPSGLPGHGLQSRLWPPDSHS